ncbi:MAG TPA: choice-of-anchor tandem repeat GloVer-containing protein [Terriglobales bacterium]|nr:choice-of-anchor tandem repeat GloVer-containing protein [Terriglobales bacterium]
MKKAEVARTAVLVCAFCVAMVVAASAQKFAAESFDSSNGGNPSPGAMVQGFNGNLYGTTYAGGANSNCANGVFSGCGTVFQLSPSGKLSALYSFCSLANCADGIRPASGVILGADGNLYGTTDLGGANNGLTYLGGTVFRLTSTGKLRTLYSFCSQLNSYDICLDGAAPNGLVQARDGNLYGTTAQGGNGDVGNQICNNPDGGQLGCGTIFKIDASGKLTTLYDFCLQLNRGGYCPDGAAPQRVLVQARDRNLYGTTPSGGANPCSFSLECGTIFRISRSGTFSRIYSFCPDGGSCADGNTPSVLIAGVDGNLYGIASQAGPLGGGSIFQLSPTGKLTTIYGFCNSLQSACPDGSFPLSLLQATDGNLYGTTGGGGTGCIYNSVNGCGTIFRLTTKGVITTLHSFCQNLCDDGYDPYSLAQGTNGILYGTTEAGGADQGCTTGGCGAVYGLSAGLKPLVESSPDFGRPGQTTATLGNNLGIRPRIVPHCHE